LDNVGTLVNSGSEAIEGAKLKFSETIITGKAQIDFSLWWMPKSLESFLAASPSKCGGEMKKFFPKRALSPNLLPGKFSQYPFMEASPPDLKN